MIPQPQITRWGTEAENHCPTAPHPNKHSLSLFLHCEISTALNLSFCISHIKVFSRAALRVQACTPSTSAGLGLCHIFDLIAFMYPFLAFIARYLVMTHICFLWYFTIFNPPPRNFSPPVFCTLPEGLHCLSSLCRDELWQVFVLLIYGCLSPLLPLEPAQVLKPGAALVSPCVPLTYETW